MRQLIALASIFAALMPVALTGKGATTRITITDIRLGRSIDITDPNIMSRFNVWAGRGSFSGPRGREAEGTEGFIIDWPAGVVSSRPADLHRYEVKFYARHPNARAEQLVYVVIYERDWPSREGFVYLPGRSDEHYGRNVQAIYRGAGIEGSWFRASRAWEDAVGPLLRTR